MHETQSLELIANNTAALNDPQMMAIPVDAQYKAVIPRTEQRSFRRLLYMYGAVTQIELNSFLETTSIDTEERKREVKAKWPRAAEIFQGVVTTESDLADSISALPLGANAAEIVKQLQSDPAFVSTFSNFPLSFEEVEIDKLVASQRTVHLDFVERLQLNYTHTEKDLLRFCLDPGRDETPLMVGRTALNGFTFSSENPGLRFLGVSEQPYRPGFMGAQNIGGQAVRAVVLVVGYGSPTANVYRVGKRLILSNGFHRLYALRTLGITHAPVAVQQVTHPDLELPPIIADLPREYLVKTPRPGLMRDFFDERLTCEIRQPNFLKALQVGWGSNESRVPR